MTKLTEVRNIEKTEIEFTYLFFAGKENGNDDLQIRPVNQAISKNNDLDHRDDRQQDECPGKKGVVPCANVTLALLKCGLLFSLLRFASSRPS